jgi:hypothetical protein
VLLGNTGTGKPIDPPSTSDEPDDSWVRGISDASVTISGEWNPSMASIALDMPAGQWSRMRLAYGARTLFGIEWWSERAECDVCVTGWDRENNEATFSIVSEVAHERAEWWRRWGYALVRHLPERRDDVAQESQQPEAVQPSNEKESTILPAPPEAK